MNAKKLKTLAFLCGISAMTLMTSGAYAKALGGDSGGGGDAVIISAGKIELLDLAEKNEMEFVNPQSFMDYSYLWRMDVLNTLVKASENVFKDKGFDPYRFNYFIQKSLGVNHTNYSDLVNEMLVSPKEMTFYFTDMKLEEINDEGKIHIRENFQKTQLAVQNKEGVVIIYKPLFMLLSTKDQSALFLHEALLRFVWQYNPNHLNEYGTEKIRKLNQYLIKKLNKEYVPESEIVAAFQSLGIETLSNH